MSPPPSSTKSLIAAAFAVIAAPSDPPPEQKSMSLLAPLPAIQMISGSYVPASMSASPLLIAAAPLKYWTVMPFFAAALPIAAPASALVAADEADPKAAIVLSFGRVTSAWMLPMALSM